MIPSHNANEYAIKGQMLWPNGTIKPGQLRIKGGIIVDLVSSDAPLSCRCDVLEINETDIVAPGLIDLQVNGAFGHDFTADPGKINSVAEKIVQYGVTSFLPTIITSPLETYRHAIAVVNKFNHGISSSHVLGLHLEGPFLNPKKVGAHNCSYLRLPSEKNDQLFFSEEVKLLTLAPELPGCLSLIEQLSSRNILVSLGHSDASYEQAVQGLQAGAKWGTHLFNAMSGLHHRHPGLAGALLSDKSTKVGLIADGIHVHPAIIKIIFEIKGAQGITLVSDAMAAVGMEEGEYILGDQQVLVDGTSAQLEDGTLAGSLLTLDRAIKNMIDFTGCSLAEAIQMASTTPALTLNIDNKKGKLMRDHDADIIILDEKYNVKQTMVAGKSVYLNC